MKFVYKFLAILVIGLMASCESTENLLNVQEAKVVVKAYLYADTPISIQISKEILFKREESDSVFSIEGLDVTLNDGTKIIQLVDAGNGNYTSSSIIEPSKSYTLNFMYNELNIYSETSIPTKPVDYEGSTSSIEIIAFTGGGPPPASESLELSWTNDDDSYFIVVVTNLEENPILINDSGFQRPSFRSEPIVDDNYEVRSQDFNYLGNHSVILFKVLPEYAALYEDPGDNTLTIKTPFTNVDNGLGIFTAINSDTVFVDVFN